MILHPRRCIDFLRRTGINTHIGNAAIAPVYAEAKPTLDALAYLGIRLVRDTADYPVHLKEMLAADIRRRVVGFIGEVPPEQYHNALIAIINNVRPRQLAALEGVNEVDAPYSRSVGGTPETAAQFQKSIYEAAVKLRTRSIANSWGVIWPDPGSYGCTGDLAHYADWGNAHTYFDPHQCGPNGNGLYNKGVIHWLNTNAVLTTPNKPVAHTEFGWSNARNAERAAAAYTLMFYLSGILHWHMPLAIAYALFDDSSGNWGWFENDGTPRVVANAVKNMVALLDDRDPDALSAPVQPLEIQVHWEKDIPQENTHTGPKVGLLQKTNGEYWLPLWNEQRLTTEDAEGNKPITVAPVTARVILKDHMALAGVYDPLTGMDPAKYYGSTAASTMNVSVPPWPVFCKLVRR